MNISTVKVDLALTEASSVRIMIPDSFLSVSRQMSNQRPPDDIPAYEDSTLVEEEVKTKVPPRYRVIIHNDNYTTMDFVVHILIDVFHKSHAEATFIMLTIHRNGFGACGEYSRDVAETKVAQVTKRAQEQGHPLLCTMEKV